MAKQITLLCDGGQQFVVMVLEEDAQDIVKRIRADIKDPNPEKYWLNLSDYISSSDLQQPDISIKSKKVAVVIMASPQNQNITIPNKKLLVPMGRPN